MPEGPSGSHLYGSLVCLLFSLVTPGQFPTNWFAPVKGVEQRGLTAVRIAARAILIDILFPPCVNQLALKISFN